MWEFIIDYLGLIAVGEEKIRKNKLAIILRGCGFLRWN